MLLSIEPLCAQQQTIGKIEGKVVDNGGRPLALATVSVKNSSLGTVTDEQGNFSIHQVPAGEKTLIISSVGYATKVVIVANTEESDKMIIVQLEESVQELSTVVVTATRSERQLGDLPIPVTVIAKEQISNMGSLRLNDVLAEQTGLAIVSDHGTGIQVQGFSPEYTLLLIDGEPLIGRTAGTFELNRIAVGNIKQIEIVKGPSSSLYGSEALAGVVNIITDKPEGIGSTLQTRYGTNNTFDLSSSATYQGSKFGAYIFADRYSTGGYDLTPESFGNTVEPFENYTFNSRLTYDLSSRTKLNLSGRYFTERQESRFNIGTAHQPEIVSGNGEVKDWNINPVVTHTFSDKLKTTFRFYGTRYRTESAAHYESDGSLYDQSFFNQTFNRPEIQSEYFFNKKNILTMGVGRIWESVEATRYEKTIRFTSNYIYFQHEWTSLQKLNVIAGGRYDAHSVYGSQFSPKLSVQYDALSWLAFQGSMGVGFKAPDFRQLYLNFTNAVAGYSVFGSQEVQVGISRLQSEGQISELLMDPSQFGAIRAESSIAYNLGLRLKPTSKASVNINLFRNDIRDLIQTQAVARKTNGQLVFSYFNLEQVFTQGIETDLSYSLRKPLRLSLGYQLLVAKDKSVVDQLRQGEVYARDPETQATYRVAENDYGGLFNRSRHMLNAKAFYDNAEKGWNASVRMIYRGRYGFGDRNGNAILDADNEYVDGYLTVNISAAKTFRKILKLQVGCDNLFDCTDPEFITALPGRLLWTSMTVNLISKQKLTIAY